MKKMTASQITANNRISDIDDLCRTLREDCEREARHSAKHDSITTCLHNLNHEREMLVAVVGC